MSYAQSNIEHFTLNGQDFTIITESYDDYESKGRVAKFYRDEHNYDLTYLFAVTLEDKTGTCGARSIENGIYEIGENNITVYTRWEREGKAYLAPKGYRILTYTVDTKGKLYRSNSAIYLESAHKAYADEGMRYLFKKADTPEKKRALQAYIDTIQKRYKANFVIGENDRKKLEQAVFKALQRKSKKRWQ
jgi:hypothetical protein